MPHPDENGNIQYYKITQSDRLRYRVKAAYRRFMTNADGLWWVLRKLWRDGD